MSKGARIAVPQIAPRNTNRIPIQLRTRNASVVLWVGFSCRLKAKSIVSGTCQKTGERETKIAEQTCRRAGFELFWRRACLSPAGDPGYNLMHRKSCNKTLSPDRSPAGLLRLGKHASAYPSTGCRTERAASEHSSAVGRRLVAQPCAARSCPNRSEERHFHRNLASEA